MAIAEVVRARMVEAMKAKDKEKKDIYAYLLDQIQKEQKSRVSAANPNPVLTEADEIAVCQRVVKAMKSGMDKSIEEAKAKNLNLDNMKDYIADCEFKISVYSEFLPKQMSEDEINAVIDEVMSGMSRPVNQGMVIKATMGRVKGLADGKLVSELVKVAVAKANA